MKTDNMHHRVSDFSLIILAGCMTFVTGSVAGSQPPQDQGLVYSLRFGEVPTHLALPIEQARSHLATHLGVARRNIEAISMHEVVWPDRCLGLSAAGPCPRVATPGYRILLRSRGQKYRYHADLARDARFAGAGDLPSSLPRAVEVVRDHLASRLDVTASSVAVIDLEEKVWPNTCLGLPAPEMCVPGETLGYRVILLALGQAYRFHTDFAEMYRFAGPGDSPQRPD